MAKIKGLEDVVPESILASAWVEPKHAVASRAIVNLAGGAVAALASANLAKQTALVAVADGLWLVPLKPGLMSMSAQTGGIRLARADIQSMTTGSGVANVPVILTTSDGTSYEFSVHKSRHGDVAAVMGALGLG